MLSTGLIERLYLHTPPSDLECHQQGEEKVSQKQFMRPLMGSLFRIGSSSTVGVEGHTHRVDWQALCIILPISRKRSWG
jgi:hypothetical protein